MLPEQESPRGRGTGHNPGNRFELLHYERDPEQIDPDTPAPLTQFLRDRSRSVIAYNDSPDIGFSASLNVYRGCEHGCIYCYARPFHEYLGFSAGLDFETRIMVKEDAPQLLRKELTSKKWQPQVVAVGTVTDSYQPIERKLELTRRCLEVLLDFRNPVGLITKNHLISRDRDLLAELAREQAVAVYVSVTTLDADLARKMEPRASQPQGRLAAIEELASAGIPVGVMVAPIIPGLNDHEIPAILAAAAKAGARFAGFVMLRLPHAVSDLFIHWLEEHFPRRKDRILGRVREIRDGKLSDPQFGSRMVGTGVLAEQIKALYHLGCRKAGIDQTCPTLSTAGFRIPGSKQGSLFEDL